MLTFPLYPQVQVDLSDRPDREWVLIRTERELRRKNIPKTVHNQWIVEARSHDYEYMLRVTREYFTVIEKNVDALS